MERSAYWLLSAYYGSYFAILGVWIPYWPLYLSRELGFDARAIGILTALALGIKVVGPPLWGGLADRGSRRGVLVATSWATVAAFSAFLLGSSFPFMVMVTVAYSLFHAGPLALVEATTMETASRHGADYGRIRLWGSVGFILLSMGLGPLVDRWGLVLVLPAIIALHSACATLAGVLPRGDGHHDTPREHPPVAALFANPGVRWFYLSTLLMQFSHAAYYGFMSIHLENHGYSRTAIGMLWALGVVAEVVVMAYAKPLLKRVGVSGVLTGSLLLACLRWGLYAVTLWPPLLILGQLLHAFTFGSFHVAGIHRTHQAAPPGLRGTAQAWYGAFSFGIGGGLGLVSAGFLFDLLGAYRLFAVMAAAAALGVWASLRAGRHFPAAGG